MNINFGPAIFIVFISLLSVIFCSFFASKLAELKGRTKAWGFIGFLLNIIGLIIVCYLPSKREDKMETNPIAHMFSKMPSMSRKTINVVIALVIVAIVTVIAYDNVPKMIENHKYTKQISKNSEIIQDQPKLINAKVKDIFAGENSSYLISETNDLYCWGKQHSNQLEDAERGIIYKNAKKVDSNNNAIFILTNDGHLYGTGKNDYLLTIEEEEEKQFKLISEDVTDFSLSETTLGFIKTDKKLYMFGDNSYGQLGTGNSDTPKQAVSIIDNVKKVVCESTYTVVLLNDGKVMAFGSNVYGQFGKQEKEFQTPIKIYDGITDIAAGDNFIMLLNNSGNVLVCGNNKHGQLGNITNDNVTEFVQVLTSVDSIDACKESAIAISSSGELYTWGRNNAGQLGNGTETDSNTPTIVATDVSKAVTDGLHTVAFTKEGRVIATGLNTYNQLGKSNSRNTFSELVGIK